MVDFRASISALLSGPVLSETIRLYNNQAAELAFDRQVLWLRAKEMSTLPWHLE